MGRYYFGWSTALQRNKRAVGLPEKTEKHFIARCWQIQPSDIHSAILPVALPDRCRGLDAMSACLPEGSYTTFRTFNFRYALGLDDHLKRLENSAALSGTAVKLDTAALRHGLRLAIGEAAHLAGRQVELRMRLTLDLVDHPGRVFVSAEELILPDQKAYDEGVKVVTRRIKRRLPAAKLTGFISTARQERQSLPEDVYEAVMVDEADRIREGLSCNFFALWKAELWTAAEGVLPGVTRGLVLECARRLGIMVRLEAIRVEQVSSIDEAFITSSSRGVVPVRQVDATILGHGRPGEMTRRISAAFARLIEDKLEPI